MNSQPDPNGTAGTNVFTPWGIAANAVTKTFAEPTVATGGGIEAKVTTTGGLTNENVELKLKNGRPASLTGSSGGLGLGLSSFTYQGDRLTKIDGTIGGKPAGVDLDVNGRLIGFTSPGDNKKALDYAITGNGVTLTITEPGQNTTAPFKQTFKTDAVSDLTHVSGSGLLTLNVAPLDTPTGTTTTINDNLTIQANHYGAVLSKTYAGGAPSGITETNTPNPDGTLSKVEVSGSGSGTSISIEETDGQIVASSSDGTITINKYDIGLPSSVQAPDDGRSFTYDRLELRKETHTAGPWQGWVVERLPDGRGRLGNLKISQGTTAIRSFGFDYDASSRLNFSASPEITATYIIKEFGGSESLTRGVIGTTWGYDGANRLASLTNSNPSGLSFNYSFVDPNGAPMRDSRHRITGKTASIGASWSGLNYDDADQLKFAVARGRPFSYDYDTRGNRKAQGSDVTNHFINSLDQIRGRTLFNRAYGVLGSVTPNATVDVINTATGAVSSVPVDTTTGTFSRTWPIPLTAGSSAQRFDLTIRGTLKATTAGQADAVSERDISIVVPPESESLVYDGAGRLTADALWIYHWDSFGRLKQLERKPGLSTEPGALSEKVDFTYDADGRRTQKTRTLNFGKDKTRKEVSSVLWSGWLPILEIRTRDGSELSRRWFQWGRDLSGTLEDAGGIGGLVGIIEEKPDKPVRKLLPVQDGLGNVTAVLNATDGALVARYDYGPFGEPLGEYGEADVCPMRWQTKWFDAESENYYFGYRYYSPRLGSWISRDPLGETGGFNLYAYCGNDPVNRHDPTGLKWVEVEGAMVRRYWYVAGHGPLYLTQRERHRYWVEEAATPENLLGNLLNGLLEGMGKWGNEKIDEAAAVESLLAELRTNPSLILEKLGIDSTDDVGGLLLHSLGGLGEFAAGTVTDPLKQSYDLLRQSTEIYQQAKVDWDQRPNYAMYHAGMASGPTVANAVASYLLKKIRAGVGVPKHRLTNALQAFDSQRFQFGNATYILDRRGLAHILERHHPSFWNGTTKAAQSFFDPKMSVSDVTLAVESVLKQNRERLIKAGANSMFPIRGTHNGVEYIWA